MTSEGLDNVSSLLLNTEPEPDGDTITDIGAVFPLVYTTAASTCLGLDTCTVTHLRHVSLRDQVCCVAHTGLVAIYDVSSTALTRVWSVPGDPEARVTGIDTCHESDNDPRSLVTCSSDGCVRVWDTRQAGTQPTLVMRDTSEHRGPPGVSGHKPLTCVAARPGDNALVVAGTEQVGQVMTLASDWLIMLTSDWLTGRLAPLLGREGRGEADGRILERPQR